MDAMRMMARGALGMAALVVLAGCATLGTPNAPPRRVELRLDPAEWRQVLHASDEGILVTEYAAPGESAEDWTRLVSVQVYSDAHLAYPGVRPALAECRDVLQATCPGAEWTVLREAEQDAVYEWRTAGCPAEPDQHEVGRVMHGGGTWARISFSTKGRMDGSDAGSVAPAAGGGAAGGPHSVGAAQPDPRGGMSGRFEVARGPRKAERA